MGWHNSLVDSAELLVGFRSIGLALHVPAHEALVFADIHLGYEEALNKAGVLVPHFQYKDVLAHVLWAIKRTNPKRIIINGDLKHEFGSISAQEWREVMMFLSALGEYDVTLVRGNHDTIVGPIADASNVRLVKDLKLGTTLFVHGHEVPHKRRLEGVKTVVIGHEHPCVGLREGERLEKLKCHLVGRWQGRDLIVLPSLNYVTEGTDVTEETPLSPFLAQGVGGYRAWGIEGRQTLYFGEVDEINE
jgi:uncharacterized protein